MNVDDPGSSEPSDEELERVRQALDEDAELDEADLSEEERKILETLDDRVEPVEGGEASSSASEHEEEDAVEPVSDEPDPDEQSSSDLETTEDAVEPLHEAVDSGEDEPVEEEATEDAVADDPEPEPSDAREEQATDPLSEQAEQALETANRRQELAAEREPGTPSNGGAGVGVLNPFTVVAPPQGSIKGNWIVEGHQDEEELSGGIGLDEGEEIGDPWPDETQEQDSVPAWPEEDEEEPLADDEAEPWPDEEDWDEPGDEEVLEAEAEPEQQETWDDEDEEFWEDLLEDEEEQVEPEPEPEPEPDDEEPIFEDAGDWLEEEEPATEGDRAREEREAWIEESLEAEEEEDEVEFSLSQEPEEEDEDEVEFSLSEGDDNPSSELLGADAEETPDEAEHDDAYTHGPYTLYHKTVESSEGETDDLFFFARDPPEDAEASELPDGHEVGVNERTGVPFVRETDDED